MNQLALDDSDVTKFSSVNRRPRYALAMYQSLHAAASTEVIQSYESICASKQFQSLLLS